MKPVCLQISDHSDGEAKTMSVVENTQLSSPIERSKSESVFLSEYRHSLNNYLGGIISLLSLLKNEHPNDDKIDLIMESARNIEKLSKSLPKG